ncbi:MAG TPA: hypothetical protein VKE51_03850 [Vicinamibacterales bacterium]|nr:hypothetical protein [Vicinamibacterales bacterium]
MIRKVAIAAAMAWTLVVTILRAARLPNKFSTEHWLIDYRFGFVKRGLVGSVLSVVTGLAGTRPSERLIDALAIAMFVIFCAALLYVALLVVRRSRWSTDMALAALVFLSSPFVVMSAHLIGYYDNIVILLTLLSLALLFRRRVWAGAAVQAVAILVHENALLVGFPVFCWGAWLATRQAEPRRRALLPLLLPIAMFLLIAVRLTTAPHRLERSLTAYLSTYPFVADTIADVRVPHWITITFADSYTLHQGHFQERILSQPMIALVLPSVLALLGVLFETQGLAAISGESALVLAICLVPQSMHVMVWDTARTWTYSIVCAFLVLWVDVELRPLRRSASPFVILLALVALLMNVIGVTPLMDGVRERFDLTARLIAYAPILALAGMLAGSAKASGERQPLG